MQNEESEHVDLETYVRNEANVTALRLKSILRDSKEGLPCDELKKEIDGFGERMESINGERQVSLFRSSPSEPPPVSAARNNATRLYLEYSRAMLDAHKECIDHQKQHRSKHRTEERNIR